MQKHEAIHSEPQSIKRFGDTKALSSIPEPCHPPWSLSPPRPLRPQGLPLLRPHPHSPL
jgi:hypothetical protein